MDKLWKILCYVGDELLLVIEIWNPGKEKLNFTTFKKKPRKCISGGKILIKFCHRSQLQCEQ